MYAGKVARKKAILYAKNVARNYASVNARKEPSKKERKY